MIMSPESQFVAEKMDLLQECCTAADELLQHCGGAVGMKAAYECAACGSAVVLNVPDKYAEAVATHDLEKCPEPYRTMLEKGLCDECV